MPTSLPSSPSASPAAIDVSVVMPAWNEPSNVSWMMPRLQRVLEKAGVSSEVLVIAATNDDPTLRVAEQAGAIPLVQSGPGYGGALRTGVAAARGRFLLTLDADCSHDPDVALSLLASRDEADVIVASRYVRFGHSRAGRFRSAISRLLNLFLRTVLSLPVRDLTSGFRLYRRRIFDEIEPTGNDFDILPEILVLAHLAGFRILERPFHFHHRAAGRSHARIFRFGMRYLGLVAGLWWRRYSNFSADYDERAFHSRIPLQRYWQRRRYEIILGFLGPGSSLLDIGCGTSMVIMALPEAVGLDVSLKKLRYLRQLRSRLVRGAIQNLPFPDRAFDQAICSQVIEHVARETVSFREMARVLKPGGVLVIGTPDYGTPIWPLIEAVYRRVMPGGYADEHITHFTRASLSRGLAEAGFTVEACRTILGGEMILKARLGAG